MKKFIIKSLIFIFILAVIDTAAGMALDDMWQNSKGGSSHRYETIANHMTDDIIILGSSRAIHHYDPLIIQDSLGMSCYNAGLDAQGIIFNYGMYLLYSSRYTPKVIICDIMPRCDSWEEDNTKFLKGLMHYYERDGIDSIFLSVDKNMRFKMLSKLYRYNNRTIETIKDFIQIGDKEDIKGYRPHDRVMNYEPTIRKKDNQHTYDTLKLAYWEKLIHACHRKGTKLIFMASPSYKPKDIANFDFFKKMAKANGIPFIDHYADTTFCTKRKYFKDTTHMNRLGATAYTKAIIKEIKPFI